KRSQARVAAAGIGPLEPTAQPPVGLGEDVVDVFAGGRRLLPLAIPVGVGGADDPALTPRDDEQDALLGPQDDPGVGTDGLVGDHHMYALGHPHLVARADPGHLVDQVGPHPGADDDPPGRHVDVAARLLVPYPRSGYAL